MAKEKSILKEYRYASNGVVKQIKAYTLEQAVFKAKMFGLDDANKYNVYYIGIVKQDTPETIVEDKPSIMYSDGNNTIIIRENGYVIVIVDGVELERWKDNE